MEGGNRRLGFVFGVLGALLVLLEALLDLLHSVWYAITSRPLLSFGYLTGAIVLAIVAVFLGFLAVVGRRGSRERALGSGVLMILLGILGILVLGLAGGLIGILGAVFVLLGGLLYVLEGG